jgi:ribosome-associated protein
LRVCYTEPDIHPERDQLETEALVQEIVDELSERQAEDITVVDISKVAGFADRFVIGTVLSERQMNAVIDALDDRLRAHDVRLRRREGDSDAGWVLLDFSDVIVHLFGPEERAFYNLEGLWGKAAPVVRFQ